MLLFKKTKKREKKFKLNQFEKKRKRKAIKLSE